MNDSLPTTLDCSIRFSRSKNKPIDIIWSYMQQNGYDIKQEIITLLEIAFLPLALQHRENSQAALEAADYSLAQLKHFCASIRKLYHLDTE